MNDYKYRYNARLVYSENEEHLIKHKNKTYDIFRYIPVSNQSKTPQLNGFQRQRTESYSIETNSKLNFQIDQVVVIMAERWKIVSIEKIKDKRNVRDEVKILNLEK